MKKIKIIFLAMFCFVTVHLFAHAVGDIDIVLQIDREQVSIGENFEVAVIIKHAGNQALQTSNLLIPGMENFRQLSTANSTQIKMVNNNMASIGETRITAVAVNEGIFEIGPLEVKIQEGRDVKIIKSNKVKLQVVKPLAKENVFGSNQDDNMSYGSWINWKDVKIFSLILLLMMSIYYFLKGKSVDFPRLSSIKKNNHDDSSTIESKAQVSLKMPKSIPKINDPMFYDKIRLILVNFLAYRDELDISSLTTTEILNLIESKNIVDKADIINILQICDRARFAKSDSDKKALADLIRQLIFSK